MYRISRKEVISNLKTNSIDINKLYDYFLKNGGSRIPIQIFQKVFLGYVNQIGGVKELFRELIVEYQINTLSDKEGRVIKYI